MILEEVVLEERVNHLHDVLGCRDCFVGLHSGHMTYCPQSVYNSFHPSHVCQMGVPCACRSSWADVEYL